MTLKLCKGKCGQHKDRDLDFFTKGYQRYDSFCKECRNAEKRDLRAKQKKELRVVSMNGEPDLRFLAAQISELAISVLRKIQDEKE